MGGYDKESRGHKERMRLWQHNSQPTELHAITAAAAGERTAQLASTDLCHPAVARVDTSRRCSVRARGDTQRGIQASALACAPACTRHQGPRTPSRCPPRPSPSTGRPAVASATHPMAAQRADTQRGIPASTLQHTGAHTGVHTAHTAAGNLAPPLQDQYPSRCRARWPAQRRTHGAGDCAPPLLNPFRLRAARFGYWLRRIHSSTTRLLG
ncbi:hypothetical protein B0H16DRAFT_1541520 [Mycena metata]|uniref:Uncharacterized protein n=1 Tax=Mycena metata TaxID=1033252 RepID=A0AAD7J1V6_9AGAR|nr:hypothetical protein B0H16DRAFT_1541520 [Mycena metata]